MTEVSKVQAVTYFLAALALYAVLQLGLLPALLAGLLIYQLVDLGSRALERLGVHPSLGRMVLVAFLTVIIVTLITLGVVGILSQMSGDKENLVALLQKMADVVDGARSHLPPWLQTYLPATLDEWREAASAWLRANASHLNVLGREIGLSVVHLIIGMVIGGLVAVGAHGKTATPGPLAAELTQRVDHLSGAFYNVVFSQIRISALNTLLTSIYLTVVLPATGVHLPLIKTMILVTFVAGLLPILGNLISNTVIVLVALGVSLSAAVESLIFLVVIHKLEYFINARIIGGQIRARAWEILIAMLVGEAAFGIAGVIAAPIYYAYLKEELQARKLI